MTIKEIAKLRAAVKSINELTQKLKEFEPDTNISNAIANAEVSRDFIIDAIEAAETKNDEKRLFFYVTDKGVKVRDEILKAHQCDGLRNCSYKFVPTGIGDVSYFVCGCGLQVMLEDNQ